MTLKQLFVTINVFSSIYDSKIFSRELAKNNNVIFEYF